MDLWQAGARPNLGVVHLIMQQVGVAPALQEPDQGGGQLGGQQVCQARLPRRHLHLAQAEHRPRQPAGSRGYVRSW